MNTKFFGRFGKIFTTLAVVILIVGMFASVASATISSVTLSAPNGGENWSGTQNITWTQTGGVSGDTVSILLSTDSGGSYNTLIASGVEIADLVYSWNTNNTAAGSLVDGTTYKVRIMDGITGLASSGSDFTVDNTPPTIAIENGTDAGPVQTDKIMVTIADVTTSVASQHYGLSTGAIANDAACSSISSWTSFTDEVNPTTTDFSFFGADYSDYLCVKAQDIAGNIGYKYIGQLNVDNTAPSVTDYTLDGGTVDAYFNPTAPDTMAIEITADEPVTWTTIRIQDVNTGLIQKDTHPTGVSTTLSTTWDGSVSTGGPLVDGAYQIYYTITDVAGNITGPIAGPLTSHKIIVDTVKPTMDSVVATTVQGAGDTIVVTFSEDVVAADGVWSLNDLGVESPLGFTRTTTNANFSFDAGTNVLTITLDEATDGEWLKNGIILRAFAGTGFIKDMAGNVLTAAQSDSAVEGDVVVPTVGLTYSLDRQVKDADTIVITATFSEEMDNTPQIAIATLGDGSLSATNMTMGANRTIWTYSWNVPSGMDEDGIATITITGEDLAGNTMVDSTNTRTIDNTLPNIISFTNPIPNTVYTTNAILTFSAADNSGTEVCSYSLDAGATYTTMASCSEVNATVVGLAEGRNVIEVKIEDEAGNTILSGNPSFVYDTDGILTVASTGADFTTIQGAIDAAVTGINTIQVKDGSYPENVTVNKKLTVVSENGASTTTINPVGGTVVSITSSDVTLDGFTITNPDGNKGVYIAGSAYTPNVPYGSMFLDQMNIDVKNNTLTGIGTGSGVTGNIQAIIWQDDSSASNAVYFLKIRDNNISNIGSATAGSTAGIAILDSTGDQQLINLNIENNTISNINANPATKGAYGILINHANSYPGGSVHPTIKGNTISDLEGLWVHAIGLEGNTYNAIVTDNIISDLTDYKSPSDAVAVFLEDNRGLGGLTRINNNQFNAGVVNGVVLNPDTTGAVAVVSGNVLDATNNWWGDPTGPHNTNANPTGAGSEVLPAVADSQANSIDFSPFCQDQACTTLVSVDPIASFDLAFSPSSQTVNNFSTLTVTAKDAGGYVVVNDTTTLVNLNVISGTATLTDLSITMEADGDTATTITSNTVGTAGVRVEDSSNSSANGDGTIAFTAGADITAPIISNIQVISIGTDTATITWDTDEWATSQVEYGTTSLYGVSTAVDSTQVISHSVILTGLSSGTVYHFRVKSLDNNSNSATSLDNLFTTVGVDNTPPVITLLGMNPVTLTVGDTFTDPGATANDDVDGNITPLTIGGTITDGFITTTAGTYTVTYNVSDSASNPAVQEIRTVIVVDPAATPVIPTVVLNGGAYATSYTVSDAETRFADGLEFNTTNTVSFTINGDSVSMATPIVTAKTMAEATALGLHVYNVVVTSSTGDTANITVSYEVTADFDDTASLAVTGIDAVKTYATADDTYPNGWSWVYHITVPTSETQFKMKFSDFVSGANSIPATNNIRFYSVQSSANSASTTAVTITAANTLSTAITLDADLEPSTPGRQIDVNVEMKVPVGTVGGSYSASYGVESL